MHIYIPTYRRLDQLTFTALPPEWQTRTTFVLDEEDAARIKRRWPTLEENGVGFWIHPTEIDTIAKKRAFIIRETVHEKIVMMDDDLRFAAREWYHEANFKLKPATNQQIDSHLLTLEGMLGEYAHAGFSARQGNNRLPAGWKNTHRMMYVLGYRPAILREHCDLGRIETREDFDYTLQLLRKGYDNAVDCEICVDQKYNAKGGCSEQRKMETSNADAHKLADLHPGFVKAVEKDYKSSIPRVEVTVQWKKALESAGERRDVG